MGSLMRNTGATRELVACAHATKLIPTTIIEHPMCDTYMRINMCLLGTWLLVGAPCLISVQLPKALATPITNDI